MYRPVTTKQFNKDLKRAAKRGKDLSKLQAIMKTLAAGKALPPKNRD
ncbi:type II toxin-antitoxin system YafQ family toxin, partial [Halomonas sp. SIMBA_159]